MGGKDEASNLRAICSVCNEGASNITSDRPTFVKLKTQVLRATNEVQLEVLATLIRKFPRQSEEALNKA